MLAPYGSSQLTASARKLRELGVPTGISAELAAHKDSLLGSLYRQVLAEVPAFNTSGNPDLLPELEQHLSQHLDALCSLVRGSSKVDLSFVSEHARRRATQKFPLDAELDSYRFLHKALGQWLQAAAVQSADQHAQLRRIVGAATNVTIDYSGAIGSILTSEYVAHTRALAEAEGDRRTELFKLLLGGYDESDRRAAQLLRRAGYLEQRQSFCIVVARSVDPREMENDARAQRMADAVGTVIRKLPVRTLIGIAENLVTVIVSGTRRLSGWTAPQSLLADRLQPQLRTIGPAALIGVSRDAPSTSHIPAALREAKIALDFASVANRVVPFARIPFRDMVVQVAAQHIQSALPVWIDDLLAADKKSRGALLATLRAYANADMNALRAAASLQRHPNTIYARMQRIADITGLNPLGYNALTELLLATSCVDQESIGPFATGDPR